MLVSQGTVSLTMTSVVLYSRNKLLNQGRFLSKKVPQVNGNAYLHNKLKSSSQKLAQGFEPV